MLRFVWSDLLNNLTQIGLTVSAAALVLFLLRKTLKKRYPARAMCLVWAVLALRLLVPVQLTLPDPPVQVTPRTTYLTHTDFAPERLEEAGLPVLEQDGEITTRRWVTNEQAQALTPNDMPSLISFDLGRVLGIAWIAGLVIFASWQLYFYLTFHHVLEKSSHPAERDMLLTVFEEQKQQLGIGQTIPLRVTSAADCPMLAGFLSPALYLPDEALSEQDAAFIFRHELTHYKRGDLWLKLALVAARAVHWFNPLVHLMARFAQEDIELACDDAVVRGMDVDARRAYGETILRSVEAQMKKRALVSCFAGEKETLMRRFEGLFDKKVKKRGIALVVAAAVLVGTLGCAFSVGESKDKLTEETRLALAEQWAQRTESLGYTVKLDGEDTYVLYDMQWDDFPELPVPDRVAEKLTFTMGENGWQVTKGEAVAGDGVTSLDEFRILYENDLGLPDPLEVGKMSFTQLDLEKWGDPTEAAAYLLHLDSASGSCDKSDEPAHSAEENICHCTFSFDDGSEVTITMVNQFGDGWLPQDFTYDGGKNARTAADLAGQYARGVTHKSGQYIYPILSEQMQQEFRTDRYLPDGGVNWKFGGSSPSYRDYVLVPTEDEDSYLVVFQMYGGGVTDQRSAYLVETGSVDGRAVIVDVQQIDRGGDMTDNEIFRLYYDSGLAWPTIPEGANNFNGQSLDALNKPQDAAPIVLSYVGGTSAFDLISESGNEAVVRVRFLDESPSVDVQMRKTNGYWLPVGLVTQFDENFSAYLVEGDDPTSRGALPVGATVAQAIENANGNIPLLEAGQTIKLEPVDGKLTATDAVLTDAVIRADGTLQYTDKETQQTNIRFTDVYDRGSAVYLYKVEHLMAEALSSTLGTEVYRGVTVSYTANSTDYTAAFVYRLSNEGVLNTDYTIHSTEYVNSTYGYTLTLPDSFVEQGYVKENDDTVKFGLQNALPGYSDDPTDGGAVMSLHAEATASLQAQFGEDWQAGYPVPCKQLAERDGLTYYLTFASDVQYDPSDEDIAAAYTEMYQAAQAMDGSSISFDGQNDAQAGRERQQVLHDLAVQYAYMENQLLSSGLPIDLVTAEPNLTDGSCLLTVRYMNRGYDYYFTTAQRLWYDGTDSVTPARTENLVNTSDGVRSLEDFWNAFPLEQGFPVFDETGLVSLSEMAVKPASLENPDLSTPEACAEYVLHFVTGEWVGRTGSEDDAEMHLTYRWDDGEMTIRMQRVQLSSDSSVLWLPVGYDGYQPQYPPYLLVLARMPDYYPYRTTVELLQALEMGWTDGGYAESVFTELDKRWQKDADAVENAVAGFGTNVQTLWQQHKAANPDIFGA